MKKKKLVILILILYLISPIGISIWTIPNTFNFVTNDDLEESPRFKIETPKLSSGHRWILDGLGICTAYDIQEDPEIASDGEGGALITWVDLRRGWYDIYAQKVDSNGDEQWSKNGVPASLVGGQRQKPQICSDGAGGAIIVWIDNDDGHYKIYAQRINSIGISEWDTSGIAICTYSGFKYDLKICNDGAGGAIISWSDRRSGFYDIYTQLIDSNGITQWNDNGTAVCTIPTSEYSPKICSDGEGGVIITWRDQRSSNYDIYAQRIDSIGNTQWIDNGTVICNFTSYRYGPEICSDGAGGAIITWSDFRNGLSDIFAQLIDPNGITQWTANGTAVCDSSGEQYFPEICSDDEGGVIISWLDWSGSNVISAQRINSTGDKQWISNGVPSTTLENSQLSHQISKDGEGGAIIVWDGTDDNIYAQRVNSNGDLFLTEDGAPICKAIGQQFSPRICSIGKGSAIIAWEDHRGVHSDIYAQRVFNYTGDAELAIVTPESKLYTEPMAGYYPATFGFENDDIGDDPEGWIVEETGGTAQIITSHLGHSNIVELHETTDSFTEIYDVIGSKASGTVEWWVSVNRVDDWFEMGIYDGDSTDGIHMGFANDGYLKYHDGSAWTIITSYSANMWYHFKVEWDSSTDWHLWINKSSQDGGIGYSYRNSPSSLDRIRFQISDIGGHQDQYMYADAFGYSWDSNYNIGDNWEEGLLLSLELNTSIFLLEYSLDNQNNVSISGNSTIKLPKDGSHNIKLYGTTFFRDYMESETMNFIVDTEVPEIIIHTPKQGDTASDKPPYFMVSITEANVVSKWYTIDDGSNNYDMLGLFGLIDKKAWLAAPLGPVTIRIYVEDIAGNVVSEQVTINKELDIPVSLIFNIAIISMFAVIGALMVLIFREIKKPSER